MPTGTDDRLRRWSTYGVVELHNELEHLRRAAPASSASPDLERYLDERRAQAGRTYGGNRVDGR